MKVYSTVSEASARMQVNYRCCYCDYENSDDNQYIQAKAQSHGGLNPTPSMVDESRERAAEKMQSQLELLSKGDLRTAYLTCSCAKCGKRQPWASYVKTPVWAIVLACLCVILLFGIAANWENVQLNPRVVVILAMPIPLLVIVIRNAITSGKVARLDKRYLPRVTLKTRS